MSTSLSNKFMALVQIMNRLRKECPWDRQQTPESLRKYILEEAYEVIESIDDKKWNELGEELGDLLLQIIFQSEIAEESGRFTLDDVIDNINKKLKERHPHIFGDKQVQTAKEVASNWEHIKIKNENRDSLLSGVPKNAPALLQAQRLQEKASRVSFDWNDISDVITKMDEELIELKKAIKKSNKKNIDEEMGDIFFSIVNLSRFLDISAEDALRNCNQKFIRRFQYIEAQFNHDYQKMRNAGLEELDKMWNQAKKQDL